MEDLNEKKKFKRDSFNPPHFNHIQMIYFHSHIDCVCDNIIDPLNYAASSWITKRVLFWMDFFILISHRRKRMSWDQQINVWLDENYCHSVNMSFAEIKSARMIQTLNDVLKLFTQKSAKVETIFCFLAFWS